MRILVTGGAGFIGSHLCECLMKAGHQLAVVDDLNDFYDPQWKLSNLEQMRHAGDFELHQVDICENDKIEAICQAFLPEIIIHLAARAGVRPSLNQPFLYERVNVHGTLSILEASRHTGVRKVVFASSSSVYGLTDRIPFTESAALTAPASVYASTKIAGEQLCRTYSHLYGLSVICLRFFTVYGPRQRPDLAIRKFTQLMRNGGTVPMYGDGSTGRDYTYIDDIIAGIHAALGYETAFDVFNLGNSHPVLLRDLIKQIERTTGSTARIERLPDQPGDMPITFANIEHAAEKLGFRPATAFEEGLQKFVEWYDRWAAQQAAGVGMA